MLFVLYVKTEKIEKIIQDLQKEKTDFQKIRCPFCNWNPKKSSRWCCADCDAPEYFYTGCYKMWNTFDTRGKCPSCAHQWIWTSCLKCYGWSKHEDWYVKD